MTCGRPPDMKTGAAVGLVAALLLAGSCAPGISGDLACRMATEYLLDPDKSGWQYVDQDIFPAARYREIEVIECADFRSKTEEGWAAIRVHATGEAYELDGGRSLGRIPFLAEIEFDRGSGGWEVLEKQKF